MPERNFDDTLARILALVPPGETRDQLAADGKKVSTSLRYAPPEYQYEHWIRFTDALAYYFPEQDTPWKQEIGAIMRGEREQPAVTPAAEPVLLEDEPTDCPQCHSRNLRACCYSWNREARSKGPDVQVKDALCGHCGLDHLPIGGWTRRKLEQELAGQLSR